VHRDSVVEARDGVALAVRDHGGDGSPLLLMHGAGAHLLSLEPLAAELRAYRVVTMDQRWSGQSGDSHPYRWDDLVDDVECVLAALELGNAAVAGHSWGGMIAARYGARHPEAPAVINLDGHGPGDPSLYDGVDPAEVEALSRTVGDPPPWMGKEGDAEWHAGALARSRDALLAEGFPIADADEFAARGFVALPDGRWRRRPARTMYEGLTGDLKMFEVYRHVDAPMLIVVSGGRDWGPPDAAHLMAGYRRGTMRALTELAAERPNVRVVELPDTDHNGLSGRHAPAVATAMTAFLETVTYRA
jgi:pimeloyl-ACP methyl ester carboxylesterase